MLMFQTEDEDDDVPISKKFEIIVKERVASPKLKLGGIKTKFQYLDEHDDVSISKKFEIIDKERLASPKHKLGGIKTEFQYLDKHDDVPILKKFEITDKERLASPKHKLGGIETEFQYLDEEKVVPKFQYALFMDIQKNFRQIQDTQAQILDRLKNIEQSGDVDFSLNVDDIEKGPISSIERFDIIENMLKTSTNARKRKVTQIRAVGGATPRKTIKNVLNAVMTQGIQALFSKDGRKGKRKFTDTAHYKCIKEVVVGDKIGYDASSIEGAIGDILKRKIKYFLDCLFTDRGVKKLPYLGSSDIGFQMIKFKPYREIASQITLPRELNFDLLWQGGWFFSSTENSQPNWSGFMQLVSSNN
nr:uncharacterized protein LOC124808634 [Hydra vulgaris]